jgi:hypothetical protein
LPGGTEECHKKASIRIGGIPAEIQTEHLPNINPEALPSQQLAQLKECNLIS